MGQRLLEPLKPFTTNIPTNFPSSTEGLLFLSLTTHVVTIVTNTVTLFLQLQLELLFQINPKV